MNGSDNRFRPVETIQKILISSTSRFVGEYCDEDVLITHAWQNVANSSGAIRMEETPVSRNGFVIVFETHPYEKAPGVAVPNYAPVGEIVCSYLSVLFGKRFDCHGLIEGDGCYNTPDMTAYNSICNPKFPFNSHIARNCFMISLDLSQFGAIVQIFTSPSFSESFKNRLNAACKFYMQSLQMVEYEPEVAYLHLITVGEILSGFFKYDKEDLLDCKMLENLSQIASELDNGERICRQISNRLTGIKRSFVKSLVSLLDENFYISKETGRNFGYFKAEDIEKRIGAAYDLRSKYVHTGAPFGHWVRPSRNEDDIQIGRPVVADRDFSKVLHKAPTYLGLERLIRYCLLKFMADNGFEKLRLHNLNALSSSVQ